MDVTRFDRFTLSLAGAPSRRSLLVLASIAMGTGPLARTVTAKKRRKKQKVERNAFGCVDVGKACRGNSANCCSGVCQGKKPKKGKKDKSRCVDHDAGSCLPGQDSCVVRAECGAVPECFRTTGNGVICGLAGAGACTACKKDADCEADFGPGAACIICPPPCPDGQHTACIPPAF